MDTHSSEKGFTLVSTLIICTVIFMTLPFLVFLTSAAVYDSNYDELSIQQFFHFLRDEVLEAKSVRIENDSIRLRLNDNSTASLSKYSDQIIRRVNGVGHEVYLRDIKDAYFTETNYGIHVVVVSLEGERYEKEIIFYE